MTSFATTEIYCFRPLLCVRQSTQAGFLLFKFENKTKSSLSLVDDNSDDHEDEKDWTVFQVDVEDTCHGESTCFDFKTNVFDSRRIWFNLIFEKNLVPRRHPWPKPISFESSRTLIIINELKMYSDLIYFKWRKLYSNDIHNWNGGFD